VKIVLARHDQSLASFVALQVVYLFAVCEHGHKGVNKEHTCYWLCIPQRRRIKGCRRDHLILQSHVLIHVVEATERHSQHLGIKRWTTGLPQGFEYFVRVPHVAF